MRSTHTYDSDQRRSPFLEELQTLIQYRELVRQLISRAVKTRYKRSVLGVAWTMINPLLTMGVLTIVFSGLFRYPSNEYALHVLSGLILWNFFAQSTTAAMGELMWSGGLVGRIYLPKSAFAVGAIGTGMVNLALAIIPYFIIAAILGEPVPITVLWIPIPILLTAMFTLGVALAVSTAVVFFQDVLPTYEILLTAWFYLTPVIYPFEFLPENIQRLVSLNPMYLYIESFRSILFRGELPSLRIIGITIAVSCGALIAGWWIFTRRVRDYAYRL
ncbi:MAG: ABC transporter permease [Anaerolineales bacterium]|nr:ABC transporter permease [Anaerolineales bacterium]